MQIGITWPLQRLLKQPVPYGPAVPLAHCWDAHCIDLRGHSTLLLVHSPSRYAVVRMGMTPSDWQAVHLLAVQEIRLGLREAGLTLEETENYLLAAGQPAFTRTHGRRPVAYLNRVWESVLAADLLADPAQKHQKLLAAEVNRLPGRCAALEGVAAPAEFLRRCVREPQQAGLYLPPLR